MFSFVDTRNSYFCFAIESCAYSETQDVAWSKVKLGIPIGTADIRQPEALKIMIKTVA